jgi:transposase
MNDQTPIAAWIGWDWADQHHDLFLESADGKTERIRLPHRPEKLHAWFKDLGQRFQQRPVVLCMEACLSALLSILLEYPFLRLYLVNPKCLTRFRQAMRPSGSKSDDLDCQLACQLAKSHAALLNQFVAQDPVTQELAQWVSYRRDLVNERAAVANKLTATLKLYYPLALELLQNDTTTELAADFILKYPTLAAVQEAPLHRVRQFFLGHSCRLTEGLEKRLAQIAPSAPVSTQAHWNNPHSFMACALADQLKALGDRIDQIEERIAVVAALHPNAPLAKSVPGAGPALEPRLMAALGTRPESLPSAEALAVRSGVAPRRIQSGNTCLIQRRWAKPQFEHQTWIEFAQHSTLRCAWAKEFLEVKIKSGKTYYTAVRALAYKWMRIIHACWEKGEVYDEAKYLKALARHGSQYSPKTEAKA